MGDPQVDNAALSVKPISSDVLLRRLQTSKGMEEQIGVLEIEKVDMSLNESTDFILFNPLAINRKFQSLKKRVSLRESRSTSKKEEGEKIKVVHELMEIAEEFCKKNPEFQPRALVYLHQILKDEDSPEEILKKLLASYPDLFLVHDALEFLITSLPKEKLLHQKCLQAKDILEKEHQKEILIGKNISIHAREFSKEGFGSPTALRELYKEVVTAEIKPIELLERLLKKFNYEQMKSVLGFMLSSLGKDLRSKQASTEPLKLTRLCQETRSIQAMIGIYLFFRQEMEMIQLQFQQKLIPFPEGLTFPLLAKQYISLVSDRYPSQESVLRLALDLFISHSRMAQTIVFNKYAEAIRATSPLLFKSAQHREDIRMALVETIESLEESMETESQEKKNIRKKP